MSAAADAKSPKGTLSKRYGVTLCGEASRLVEALGREVLDTALRVTVEDCAQGGGDLVDRVHITGSFRPHPTRLAAFITKKTTQERPKALSNTILLEKVT